MNRRGYNFGAGPAMLPESILQEAQAELLSWKNLGMSVLEVGHRTEPFVHLMQQAETDLRDILDIPNDYHVLFLPFPARTQFAMVPLNLLAPGQTAGYYITGLWSQMAYQEALRVSTAYCIASSEESAFCQPIQVTPAVLPKTTKYVYYTPNETVHGVRLDRAALDDSFALPVVADMTSCLLSEPLNVRDYGLIFAGAQKNIAPAGLTLVIMKADLLPDSPINPSIPTMLDYATHVNSSSLYATPGVFQCYMAAKMFGWVKQQGGVVELYRANCRKADKLYRFIDASSAYECRVDPTIRSRMNVCFFLKDTSREAEFLQAACARGLYALKGHRLVGGLRASLYNAMPEAGVDALIDFMQAFQGM